MKYCDISLPVPLSHGFTYRLPETLWHRVRPGCRALVPFGSRKLTGVVLALHDTPPAEMARDGSVKEVLRLLDEEPVLDAELLALGRWIADYYCAPLGEVLRSMTPLSGEVRKTKLYSLTDAGRDAARQLLLSVDEDDPALEVLRLLEHRPLSASYLKTKLPAAANAIRSLEKKGFIAIEDLQAERDPLRASAARLRASWLARASEDMKLTKRERELHAFLELHPGTHNLEQLEASVKGASQAARSLARRKLIRLEPEAPTGMFAASAPPKTLNPHQLLAYQEIEEVLRGGKFHTFLLEGVTGSGKTEVYLKSIDACIALGRSALLLVPEIALTPAVAGQFFQRFGDRVAILHSAFHDAERAEQWRRIRGGQATVVVGTRSGVFAPVQNLGLVVIDEEHDGSYKQQETPRYNGRDVAIVRAQAAGAVVVLGSATPSLESRYNAERGKYTLIQLPERIESRPMPDVEVIDMRQEFLETRKLATFSRRLVEAVTERLANHEQTMLLLNRRGFSSFVACRACGERVECVNCAVTLTYHRRDRRMLCHYCNYAQKVPSVCPKCGSEYLQFIGTGSEKVEEELHRDFPTARIARMDRDTVSGKRHFESILHGFREGDFDILVGTQMIAKGHDIPNVTLVGAVSADIGLGLPDFRSAERTFQLLTQAAGRAGRGNLPGIVLIQTINPEHYAIRFASEQNYEGFYQKELQFRKLMRYPPFAALANVLVRSQRQEQALEMSTELGRLLDPAPEGVKVLGPAEAPVPKLKSEFRYQLLLKAASRKRLNETLRDLQRFAMDQKWAPTGLVIDVDPLTLL
ncbi:MAG TPA: primosomal protein N' [Bryobacteraceae bacterium]|nr:primosomal protein N' [Bryobacteraceae bacterium]